MEIRTCTEIVIKKEGGEYVLHCPQGVTHHETYAVANEIMLNMAEAMREIAYKTAPKKIPDDKANPDAREA